MPVPLGTRGSRADTNTGSMNALIFVLILTFAPGQTEASFTVVWLFLVVVEWLADRFAGWLAKRWSTSRGQDAIPLSTGR